MSASSDNILTVRNLSVGFDDDQPVVRNISFGLKSGEIKAIVGESGSGKSLTVFSLVGLIKGASISGEAIYTDSNGSSLDLLKIDDKTMADIRGGVIGFVFQEPMTSLNPSMRCGYQITEAIIRHLNFDKQAAKKRTLELFEEVKLLDGERLFRSYPHELSGGQRQRVMIAMALAANPAILIADEPTTALDASVQKSVVTLIMDLAKKRHMGVLFISHDLGLVQYIADETLVMNQGEVVESGLTADLMLHPQHAYTKALINCRPALHYRLSRLPVIDVKDEPTASAISNTKQISNDLVVSAKGLTKDFILKKNFIGKPTQTLRAVDDISFDIRKGQTLSVVGESGSGKSTLSRLLLKLTPLDAGSIFLGETDVAPISESAFKAYRRQIQLVFQDPYSSLNPYHRIGDIIAEPLHIFQIDTPNNRKERVAALLKKVKLPVDFMARYPHQLSGGQRQRICIARALATSPQFIVCDESVAALDVSVQAKVLNLLKDLQDELQLSYLFITHDLHVARFISDYMLVMRKGRAEEYGDSSELFENPQSNYLKNLLSNIF